MDDRLTDGLETSKQTLRGANTETEAAAKAQGSSSAMEETQRYVTFEPSSANPTVTSGLTYGHVYPDMPRRPLSAYNLFFREEREKMLIESYKSNAMVPKAQLMDEGESDPLDKSITGGGIGFANLARTVAAKWKNLPAEEKAPFEQEAAQERARYDSQMLGWRAAQEQKKAYRAGGSQIVDTLTFGATLQSHAARLAASQQLEYPEAWFQAADDLPRPGKADNVVQVPGLDEQQQHRALLVMEKQHLQMPGWALQIGHRNSERAGIASAIHQSYGIDMDVDDNHLPPQLRRQQQADSYGTPLEDNWADKKLPANHPGMASLWPNDPARQPFVSSSNPSSAYELRTELSPLGLPTLLEQESLRGLAGVYRSHIRQLGEETRITAGILQQSFWGASASVQNQQRPFTDEMSQRGGRAEHRASMGMPPGYQPLLRQAEHGKRMARSQSFPPNWSSSPKVPSPEDHRGKLSLHTRGTVGQESPLTPLQSHRFHASPHSTTYSIMNSPNMVPTPPQQSDAMMSSNSESPVLEMARPLSAPPPHFPGEEEFQSGEVLLYNIRRRNRTLTHSELTNTTDVGEIRLCEEMAAEMNALSSRNQGQQGERLLQSAFEALDSRVDDDAVNFLSNLKFEV